MSFPAPERDRPLLGFGTCSQRSKAVHGESRSPVPPRAMASSAATRGDPAEEERHSLKPTRYALARNTMSGLDTEDEARERETKRGPRPTGHVEYTAHDAHLVFRQMTLLAAWESFPVGSPSKSRCAG